MTLFVPAARQELPSSGISHWRRPLLLMQQRPDVMYCSPTRISVSSSQPLCETLPFKLDPLLFGPASHLDNNLFFCLDRLLLRSPAIV